MSHRNLGQKIAGAIVCMTLLLTIGPKVLAAEPHENPELAKPVFSGISLFNYYADSLDFVLRRNPAEVEARLEKMPFASVPQGLEGATNIFASNGISISYLVVKITQDMDKLRILSGQFRAGEAADLVQQISGNLSEAYNELDQLEQATLTAGETFNVSSTPVASNLRQSYNAVLDRIDRIRKMLDIFEELLKLADLTPEELLKLTNLTPEELLRLTNLTPEELLKPTELTLEIHPTIAFVGDNISFEGVLTSGEQQLVGRDVDILLDGSRYVTARTDSSGHYQGTLQIPYRYVPELDLQALYYPRDKDVGFYLASLSRVMKVTALFYEANLAVLLEDKTYPGLETTVTGSFDYGQSPPLDKRRVEVYLDNVLILDAIEQKTFSEKIKIDPETAVGEHSVTVSAAPVGRYSSVVAGAAPNVTQAVPILDMSLPRLALIPGSVGLTGILHSDIGPLDKASVKMGLGKSQIEVASSEDGAFDTKISAGMGLGLIGSQDLVIQIIPKEPWNAALVTTRRLLIVNWVNCGIILIIFVLLSVYLPRRLQRRFGVYPGKREKQIVAENQTESAPTYSHVLVTSVHAEERGETQFEPRDRIFNWYRLVARLIQTITKVLLGPQQTLREFAAASSKILGPAAKYFMELTMVVEKLLYSRYAPSEEDAEKSKALSNDVEEGLKGEGI